MLIVNGVKTGLGPNKQPWNQPLTVEKEVRGSESIIGTQASEESVFTFLFLPNRSLIDSINT